MPELALHILDLVQNSVSAGATRVVVTIAWDTSADTLLISIEDDGKGMPPELLARVASPFTTTRTTRKVGLGIPLFKQLAEMCGGELTLQSTVGKGTKTQATFTASHMDLPPMGDLKGTMETLIIANPERPDLTPPSSARRWAGFRWASRRSSAGSASISPRASAGWSRPGPADEKHAPALRRA